MRNPNPFQPFQVSSDIPMEFKQMFTILDIDLDRSLDKITVKNLESLAGQVALHLRMDHVFLQEGLYHKASLCDLAIPLSEVLDLS